MLTNINTILKFLNVKHIDMLQLNTSQKKKLFQSKSDKPDWRCELIQELLSILDKQFFVEIEQQEIKQLLEHISTQR